MSKVAGMRWGRLLLGIVAGKPGQAKVPIRHCPEIARPGAGFTSKRCDVWRGLAMVFGAILAAGQAWSAPGRTPGSFAVSSTGEAHYSIPIFAPPGVNGLVPDLSLTYGHRHDGTLAGVGWGVSGLLSIHRCAKTWAQNGVAVAPQNAVDDRYCLDGVQLRLYSGTYGQAGSTYRTEIESYSRVTALGTAGKGPASFTMELKNGLIYEFGGNSNSRILSLGQAEVRAWALNRIRDRAGNQVLIAWHNDTTNGSYRVDRIEYAPNAIVFQWESKPADEIRSGFVTGSKVQEIHRLQVIDVQQSGASLRRYELAYEGPLSTTSRSRLATLRECVGADCRKPTIFEYQDGSAGLQGEMNTGQAVPAGARPIDLNGDGREDLIYVSSAVSGSGTWRVMLANGSGGYSAAIDTLQSNLNYSGAIPIDFNHDGMGDVLVPGAGTNPVWRVMLGSSNGLGPLTDTNASATTTGRGSNACALDIDGDGREDLVWADRYADYEGGDAIRYRLRNSSGNGFGAANTLVGPVLVGQSILDGVFPAWSTRLSGRMPDFNGDGRGDIAYRHTTRVWNQELGGWDYTRTVKALCVGGGCSFSQNLAGGAGPLSFGDFNADGLTDLFYYSGQVNHVVNSATWWYALSRGTSFSPPVQHGSLNDPFTLVWVVLDWDADGKDDVLAGYGTGGEWRLARATGLGFGIWRSVGLSVPNASQVAVTDVDGDGLHDFAYSSGGQWRFRPHQGTAPDLMSRLTDAYGNTVEVTYAPLTASGVHTRRTGAAFPEQEWQGPLTVVTEHRLPDGVGGSYTIAHAYEGARQHRQGRGFEGFRRHVRVDSRNGVRIIDDYGQLFPHTGITDSAEVRQANSTLIAAIDSVLNAAIPTGGIESRTLPYVSQRTHRNYGVGSTHDGTLLRTVVTDTTLDAATGTPIELKVTTTEASSANGIRPGASWVERTSNSQLLTSTAGTNWCVGRPQLTQQINSHSLPYGAAQTRTFSTSWDSTFCRPTRRVIEPDHPQFRAQTDLAYDSFGNVQSRTVSGGGLVPRAWRTTWSADGRFPNSIRNPLNETTQRTFDARFGLPAIEVDPNGIQTTWAYDGFGRPTRETLPDLTATDWSYTECTANCGQNRLVVTAARKNTGGGTIRTDHAHLDAFDRAIIARTQLLGGGFSRVEIKYDAHGRVVQESAPCIEGVCTSPLHWTSTTYDLLGRPRQVSRPFTAATSQSTSIAYSGLTTSTTDPLGKLAVRVRDALGRLVRSADDDGYAQTFEYDAFGNAVRVADSGSTVLQQSTYNARGLRTSAVDSDRGAWQYAYNPFGELTSHTDANGNQTVYTWDALGRPLTRSMPEGIGTITRSWTWGAAVDNSAGAKFIGRLKESQVSGAGVTTYREVHSYDSKGRPVQTQYFQGAQAIGAVNLAYQATTGLVDSLTYPVSTAGYRLKLQYEYDRGLLNRVRDFNAASTVYWAATSMDAYGQIIDETLGNGLRTIRGAQPRTGLLESITSGPSAAPTASQDLEYVWDAAGNLSSRQDHNQSLNESFEYDDLHRLTRARRNGTETLALTYGPGGNIASQSGVGTYGYDAVRAHAVTAITSPGAAGQTFAYDHNGNMTSRNGGELLWFADNRAKRIRKTQGSAASSSEFEYGADGQRWYHKYNVGGTIYTHVDQGGLLEIVTKGAVDDFRHTIHANGVPVALYSRKSTGANTLRYLLRDHLGSVDAITTSMGTIELKESFSAFGQRRGTNWTGSAPSADVTALRDVSRRGFTDHEMLDQTGLIHMNGRVYDPKIARFVSADPFIDGIANTQGWNRYSYVGNSPLSYVDPSGYVGVPRGADPPPEGTPDDSLWNSRLCIGSGHFRRCLPGLGFMDNARLNDLHFVRELTESQQWAIAMRRRREHMGTTNDMGFLGEAAAPDFIAADATDSDATGNHESSGFEDWKILFPALLLFDIEDYAIDRAPRNLQGPHSGCSFLFGIKGATKGLTTGTNEAFHYTFRRAIASIQRQGLRPGAYTTLNGKLSPLQAHIELALPANRGLPDALVRIDLAGMRAAGYQIPEVTKVGRMYRMPGGGFELQFPYPVPPQFITVIER